MFRKSVVLKTVRTNEFDFLSKLVDNMENKIQYNWDWLSTPGNTVVFTEKGDIVFHPIYSSGTAIVRGCKPFLINRHYFWEFKICSKLYGTDVVSIINFILLLETFKFFVSYLKVII